VSIRRITTLGIASALIAGSFAAPGALGAPKPKPKPKPKPITGSYQASALPDPSATSACQPLLPTARFTREFKVPAAGRLLVELQNTLDWAAAVRAADGTILGDADASSPEVKEAVEVTFKKAQKISIDACNFAGEPEITVKYTFTYK
jgi:hypothetical protein